MDDPAYTPGGLRRSARNSSRAGSAEARATPQPARSTSASRPNARQAAGAHLPAVTSSESHAYGAQGKVQLGSQTTTTENRFATSFVSQRGPSAERHDEQRSPPAGTAPVTSQSRAAPPVSSRNRSQPISPLRDVTEEDVTQTPRADPRVPVAPIRHPRNHRGEERQGQSSFSYGTDFNSTVSYVAVNQPRPNVRAQSVAAAVVPPASIQEVHAARPWLTRTLFETIPHWIFTFFNETLPRWTFRALAPIARLSPLMKNLLFAILATSVIIWTFGSVFEAHLGDESAIYDQLNSFINAVSSRTDGARQSALQPIGISQDLYNRVDRVERGLQAIQGQLLLGQDSLHELQSILPDAVAVRRNDETGQWEIPNHFWGALLQRLQAEDGLLTQDAGTVPDWDKFLTRNQAQINRLLSSESSPAVQRTIEQHMQSGHIISQDMLIEHISQLRADFGSELASMEAMTARRIKTMSEQAAKELAQYGKSPKSAGGRFLQDVAVIQMARNLHLQLRNVNFFSAPLGAVVDPHMSSTTWAPPSTLLGDIFDFFFGSSVPTPHPHVKAISRWEEVTDCWCAAQSTEKGAAQLAVLMPHAIQPTSLTIEHMPAQGTLDIGSAPQNFEVWALAPEVAERKLLYEDEGGIFPICSSGAPAAGYVCIGTGRYSIHDYNHIQNFQMDAGRDVGFVNKIVVKVTKGWGADWTCIYRMRMHGDTMDTVRYESEQAAAGVRQERMDAKTTSVV